MESSRFESLTLIAAVVGAAVLGSQTLAMGSGAAAAGDIAILLAIFGFDSTSMRSMAQSLAFGGVTGFCLLTPFLWLAGNILGFTLPGPGTFSWTLIGIWLVAALILFAVDRFRMSARESIGLAGTGLAAASPAPITFTPQPAYRPAPIRVEATPPPRPAPVSQAPPAPLVPPLVQPATATSFYQASTYEPPAQEIPAYDEPPSPTAAPVSEVTTVTAPVYQPHPTAAAAVAAPPDITAIPPGREALIYLNLVGEGLNVLRTVRAENLGRDYYRIADVMPDNEQWQFTPGMVVRCRKKSLSNGKHMVAYEEAPRAE